MIAIWSSLGLRSCSRSCSADGAPCRLFRTRLMPPTATNPRSLRVWIRMGRINIRVPKDLLGTILIVRTLIEVCDVRLSSLPVHLLLSSLACLRFKVFPIDTHIKWHDHFGRSRLGLSPCLSRSTWQPCTQGCRAGRSFEAVPEQSASKQVLAATPLVVVLITA